MGAVISRYWASMSFGFLLVSCAGSGASDDTETGETIGDGDVASSSGGFGTSGDGDSSDPDATGGTTSVGDGGAAIEGTGGVASGSGGATPSQGCDAGATQTSGTFTIDVDGTNREYVLTLPDDYDPTHPYPVIFGWHPLGGSASGVADDGFGFIGDYYGLRSRAGGRVIFVAGQGLPNEEGNRGWPNTNGRDIAFLDAMLERFRGELCIDEARLLSTGFSFGGMMSDLIACQRGQTFRAIAPMAGTLITSQSTCVDEPVAALMIHGTEDGVDSFGVPIGGAEQFRNYLLETNGCEGASLPVDPSPCATYQDCDAGYPVTWCAFEGGHTVPDFASDAIWDFFSQFIE